MTWLVFKQKDSFIKIKKAMITKIEIDSNGIFIWVHSVSFNTALYKPDNGPEYNCVSLETFERVKLELEAL